MPKNRTNEEWLDHLSAKGALQNEALEDLRQILLNTAQTTLIRSFNNLTSYPQDAIDALAEDCAQEALMTVLAHLQEFQGNSKFSTWVYKFAVHVALTAARRERHRFFRRGTDQEGSPTYDRLSQREENHPHDPDLPVLKEEVWIVIRSVIENDLTPRQREVLSLIVFEEIPIDDIVERLNTNRNAVYKLLHDARHKIKFRLLALGIDLDTTLSIFGKEE